MADTGSVEVEGLDEAIASLRRFKWATAASEAADRIAPTIRDALKVAAPYAPGGGHKHLRDSFTWKRETSTETMRLTFFAGVPWARYVLEGTSAHVVRPRAARALHWDDVFSMSAHIPAHPANHFPDKAWRSVAEVVKAEFASSIRDAIGSD